MTPDEEVPTGAGEAAEAYKISRSSEFSRIE